MNEGNIGLADLIQSDGSRKRRPVVLLRQMPGYGDYLVCVVSSQLRQEQPGFDEVIQPNATNALKKPSVIRLSSLVALPASAILRVIGYIPDPLHRDLLQRLADHLTTP